jgi:hypothetical protein
MARLLVKTAGVESRALELHLGINRVGRAPDCDFPIHHPTVSASHCDLVVSNEGVMIRDCDSTNGTLVNGEPVKEIRLLPGQTVNLGGVELFVENTDVKVAIPKFERERPKPPAMLSGGAMICPRHSRAQVTYKCTHCHEVMCNYCVHHFNCKDGGMLLLCPLCSHKCEPIQTRQPKKKWMFISLLQNKVKLKFGRSASHARSEK